MARVGDVIAKSNEEQKLNEWAKKVRWRVAAVVAFFAFLGGAFFAGRWTALAVLGG